MACPYEYYKSDENYYPRLYCNIDKTMCIYSKRCQQVEKYIPLDNQEECYKYNMEIKKDIPKGSYFVRTYRYDRLGRLYIYVEMDSDTIIEIKTNLSEFNQNYIYLKEGLEGYEISLVPFEEKKYTKRTTKSNK